jgi:hypothetical protein
MMQDRKNTKTPAVVTRLAYVLLIIPLAVFLVLISQNNLREGAAEDRNSDGISGENRREINTETNPDIETTEGKTSLTPGSSEEKTVSDSGPSIDPGPQDELVPDRAPEYFLPPDDPESAFPVVAFYADNQSDTDEEDQNHQRVVDYILATEADPIFHAGDIMEDGTQDSLDRFNTVTATLRATRTFYAALGNNDREIGDPSSPSQLFLDNFVFPNNEQWYSVNYANLHMIVLDSAFSSASQAQKDWLSDDLCKPEAQSRIIGVIYHHPSFSSSISEQLTNLGVDFVVSGHLHVYSHTIQNGLDYFVLSGQPDIGYMVAEVYPDFAEIAVYDHNNNLIDTVTVENREYTPDQCSGHIYRILFPAPSLPQSEESRYLFSANLLTQD